MQEKTTYTLHEVAALLSCHTETLRRFIKDGMLRAAKIGKEWRVSKRDLEDFWTAQGGGALFEDSPPPSPPPPRKKSKSKSTAAEDQFTLPT